MASRTSQGFVWIALVALSLPAMRAWGMGEILGQTKEELKLKYDVTAFDHGNGRVTITFSISDEGRLKPLDGVELMVPARETDAGGGHTVDLAVPLDMKQGGHGNQVTRFEMTRELAARAEIWLTTTTLDGKRGVMERYHHVIPINKFLPDAPKNKPPQAPPRAKNG